MLSMYYFLASFYHFNFERPGKVAKLRLYLFWVQIPDIKQTNQVQVLAFSLTPFPHNCKTLNCLQMWTGIVPCLSYNMSLRYFTLA